MALPKKNSRIITIDESKYRWIISPKNKYAVFIAEKENIKGRILKVFFKTDIDRYWIEFPNVQDLNLSVLKPSDAELIIRQALAKNWNPETKGPPFVFYFIKKTN